MTTPWSPTDESAYIAATSQPAPEPPPQPTAPQVRASRYITIRKHLAQATERGSLTNDTYLLAQATLVLCDLLDEVSDLRADVAETNAYLNEHIVQRSK